MRIEWTLIFIRISFKSSTIPLMEMMCSVHVFLYLLHYFSDIFCAKVIGYNQKAIILLTFESNVIFTEKREKRKSYDSTIKHRGIHKFFGLKSRHYIFIHNFLYICEENCPKLDVHSSKKKSVKRNEYAFVVLLFFSNFL